MGKAAVFLDRDGVINVEKDYVYTIDEFEFIEDSIEALKIIQDKGYALVVVTNQSGIARGYYTEEDFLKLTEWMDWCLIDRGVTLDGIYYCPHHPEKGIGKYKVDCNCRKPKAGLIFDAVKQLDIDLGRSVMVGDKVSDIECGKNAGIKRNYLVRSGHAISAEDEKKATGVYKDLMAFAKDLADINGNGDMVIRRKRKPADH
ncbi:D-glycero-beta-D-manno-heptose 1,7-bisphosphate 7-phosphatase [uncultured Ruminobacter sp.]|jgi:D-glycero-D-manno-heptose 1,7-bisphosphate phosphatase|uniref:D-glycero-beta-D-manno-heptose 1,7-bisphosphate 7-phosphatase n=1 Tax=uncultured Ruminobacter sp. TaxID=538947 RepID=UPI002638A193|nr:D-glycero-beta-D-manno-heptose 1,7-bisphosphate 7-phosphatase [uncultured Ruminobacter sp.]